MSNVTNNKPPFLDPYTGIEDCARFTSWIPRGVYNFIYAVHPGRGTQQTTINLLIDKLHKACEKRGIKDFNQSELFERLLVEGELTLPEERGTTVGVNAVAQASDVGRRTSRRGR